MDPIVIADDHPLFRAALRAAVERAAPGAQVLETDSLAGALPLLDARKVGRLLDLKPADSEGFLGLSQVRAEHPAVPVAVVSASEDAATVRRALALGATGFVPKSAGLEEMVEAFRALLAGDSWSPALSDDGPDEAALNGRLARLTPSQPRILAGLREGRLNKQIAHDLGVSEATIKAHLTAVFRKLGVQNRTQAVLLARSLQL